MNFTLPPVNQRIKIIIDTKFGGNVTSFSSFLGYNSPQKINRLFKIDTRNNKFPLPSTEVLTDISNKLDMSIDELVSGNTNKSDTNHNNEDFESVNYSTKPKTNLSMKQIEESINKGREKPIEITSVYDVKVTMGSVSKLLESDTMPNSLLLNGGFKDCDGVIRHADPAMDGFFDKRSFIGIKRVSEESYRKLIIPGKCYVVVMGDVVLERFLYRGKEKPILMKTANKNEDEEFEIDFDQIDELYLIKGWIIAPELITT